MWIVRLGLRRPYTFVVMPVLIVILGILAIVRTPKDIFPDIDIPVIPVISVIWNSTRGAARPLRKITLTSANTPNHTHTP